ncbi:MAG: hypothetical protein JJ975_05805 [Bacteroidia bacterium]|nr:hypothetical protein [Bacteroidia bacterium]
MDTRQILLLAGLAVYYYLRSQAKKNKKQAEQQRKAAQAREREAQRNAPQQQPQQSRPVPQAEKSLEDILRELAGEAPRQQTPPPAPTPKPRQRAKIKHIEVDQSTPPPVSAEVTPRRKHEAPKTTIKRVIEVEEEEREELDFDLRQAVINDAILNRPEHF